MFARIGNAEQNISSDMSHAGLLAPSGSMQNSLLLTAKIVTIRSHSIEAQVEVPHALTRLPKLLKIRNRDLCMTYGWSVFAMCDKGYMSILYIHTHTHIKLTSTAYLRSVHLLYTCDADTLYRLKQS